MKQGTSEKSTQLNKLTHRESSKFASLKWKISLLSSVILLVVVTIFSVINYKSLIDSIDQQGELQYLRHGREVEKLIEQIKQDSHQLIRMIPFLKGMDAALIAQDEKQIKNAFEHHWPLLQLQDGIEAVRFYDQFNQLLVGWDSFETDSYRETLILEHVRQANLQEQPANPLICVESCIQYTIEPLLIEGIRAGTIVIGTSLTDVFLGFKRTFGSDIGLLLKENTYSAKDHDVWFPDWEMRLAALTNRERNLKILNHAIKTHPDPVSLKQGIQTERNKCYYRVKLLPLQGVSAADQAHLVVITDITATIEAIHNSTWRIVVIGLIGLIFSEILLFTILSGPLSRLKHIVFTLPLLAGGSFGIFRATLSSIERKQWLKDEIDLLYEAAVTLSHKLENLEDKVVYRTKQLVQQRDELSKEKDFIAHLLDTAQVIVLTQNVNGKIIMLNAYGEMLMRYTEEEIRGKPFLEILSPDSEQYNLSQYLEEMRLGRREQLKHETITLCNDGSKRHIVWLHSRLAWQSTEEPSVLSVGLDITEYKRVEGHLAWLADHDPLTNLFNRRRFSEELEQIISWSERYQHHGALLFFDLDRFKYINDTSGHQAGDTLLKMIADMLTQTIRSADVTGRLGGDEFAVILPEITANGAIEVAKKIIARLNETQLTVNGRTYKIAASIGIALFPEHGKNVHDLLAAADLAMYQAKEIGRGTWHLFSNDDQTRERMYTLVHWKEKIEYANLYDKYLLYFQPIMSLRDRSVTHYEVLLRMYDKDGTIHSPAAFIAAAEHTGLIHEIDHMVLRKAIEQSAKINKSGNRIRLSINLSAHAFNDPELLPVIRHELTYYNVDPTLFMFEITETAALDNLPGTRNLLREIKELGCGFVLDDFGVGFSSFYYLRELPVDAVKIDGSFVRNLASNPADQILVKALCSVARGFGKKITAEFVENEEVLALLKKMEVDFAQGYHVGKPCSANEAFRSLLP
ncbi:bifunctional diguanylate cyclase/phosphodiesterase [Nitrosomonas nitrosa]|uniref:bifunctional diguanylate cyclase/phosphodiesterase n=1 Tax=Nitrosomonas nitrosa TaxID=52442 RepID=UPI0023F75F3C|nr:EAL domain-containing protein [Nitrosomonas nitrosa]MCO6434281.1 EAL domain-containing protein [Nitrosomonas nitrosa]